MKIAQSIENELDDIFGHGLDNRVFVIGGGRDGTCGGPDGLMALHLISKCMFNYFNEFGTPLDVVGGGETESPDSELASVKKRLRKLAKKTGAWFVTCFQLHGSNQWCMAWSDSLDPSDACVEMCRYLSEML